MFVQSATVCKKTFVSKIMTKALQFLYNLCVNANLTETKLEIRRL